MVIININYLIKGGLIMQDTIRMTPAQMHERAGQYRQQAENVSEVIQNLDRLLEALLQEWSGKATEAYVANYEELRPYFEQAKVLIETIAAKLDSTANAMADLDTDIAAKF